MIWALAIVIALTLAIRSSLGQEVFLYYREGVELWIDQKIRYRWLVDLILLGMIVVIFFLSLMIFGLWIKSD